MSEYNEIMDGWRKRHGEQWVDRGQSSTAVDYADVVINQRLGYRASLSFAYCVGSGRTDRAYRKQIRDEIDAVIAVIAHRKKAALHALPDAAWLPLLQSAQALGYRVELVNDDGTRIEISVEGYRLVEEGSSPPDADHLSAWSPGGR